ncbi:MAG: hypothetical protein ABF780_05760 [Bifidobacterium aquikefiri]|uniref:Uncharacterized protein n=1 Tax=Bifidobacterium aquikefiri TaxID=1653207 RepID=A0A261G280_9BIFI|nr:hypothetical protein [Bifidobacterium aquikefiri]OZG65532.1 hypothetical protein BAQU_1715 [Bifidobacterium aquikefiri]
MFQMTRQRKPSWLRILCPDGNLAKLKPRRCTCGRWTIRCEPTHGVWESYDPGIIHGSEDLSVAIILNRRLMQVIWNMGISQPLLRNTWGAAGITPEATYLGEHDCQCQPISMKPFKLPAKPHASSDILANVTVTPSEIREFKKVWYQ